MRGNPCSPFCFAPDAGMRPAGRKPQAGNLTRDQGQRSSFPPGQAHQDCPLKPSTMPYTLTGPGTRIDRTGARSEANSGQKKCPSLVIASKGHDSAQWDCPLCLRLLLTRGEVILLNRIACGLDHTGIALDVVVGHPGPMPR